MKRCAILVSVFLLFVSLDSMESKNLLFQVEYTKPIASVQSLSIVFFTTVTPQRAEAALRDFMALAIKHSPPTVEILGTVWDSKDRLEGDERRIRFSNGKTSLVYSPKTKELTYL